MRQILSPQALKRNLPFLPAALVLGAALGMFAGGYWLSALLPASSRLLVLLTVLIGLLGAAGYWLVLVRSAEQWRLTPGLARMLLAGVAALIGVFLLFVGTSRWRAQPQYLSFLLPSHRLGITAEGAPGLAVTWFTTSLGDVSYDALAVKGWKRSGDQLVLQDPAGNSIQWIGRTGDSAQILFKIAGPGQTLNIAWDGRQQAVSPPAEKFTYEHEFDVPWYASHWFVWGLGILVLGSLTYGLLLFLWARRGSLAEAARLGLVPLGRLTALDALAILGAVVVALLLRLPGLGAFNPPVDEYNHLIAARQIVEGAAVNSVYPRSLWLVTMPVSVFLRLFGNQLWAARLPGVLFNVAAIVPLYLLAGKINRPVAIISALLYASSPWIATFARIAREYAYYPFYFYWIAYGMLLFLQTIPNGFRLARDWRTVLAPRPLLLGIALAIPPVFSIYGDPFSTFRTILIGYLVLSAFIVSKFDWRDRSNWPVLAVLVVGVLAAGYGWYHHDQGNFLAVPQYNAVPVEYFLPNPQQQWYFDRLGMIMMIGLLAAAVCAWLMRGSNILPLFLLGMFVAGLAFFAFISRTFFHTRHLLTTDLWFIVVAALGMYLVWKLLAESIPWRSIGARVILAGLLGLAVVNVPQILVPVTSTNPDNPISEDYLHDPSPVQAFMIAHVQPHDVLISTVYGLYASWREQPRFDAQFRITTETPKDEILSLIEQHPSGWIVIDQIRLDMSGLGARAFAGQPDVQYIGIFGDEHVWHWQHTTGASGAILAAGKAE